MPDEPETQASRPTPEDPHAPIRPDPLRQAKIAMASLAACIVETMNDKDATFRERFLERLDRVYENYRGNSDADPLHVLEVIHWTRELLDEWNPVPGRVDTIFGTRPAEETVSENE